MGAQYLFQIFLYSIEAAIAGVFIASNYEDRKQEEHIAQKTTKIGSEAKI